ncbi:MAG: toxin-antitoxin system YwqK family antitoxin [Candidatus Limnocylindrales bacterium]
MTDPSEPVASIAESSNGRRKFEGFLLDGEMHGAWAWYRTDGSLLRTGTFERGRQVGVWRTYDRASQVIKETTLGAK